MCSKSNPMKPLCDVPVPPAAAFQRRCRVPASDSTRRTDRCRAGRGFAAFSSATGISVGDTRNRLAEVIAISRHARRICPDLAIRARVEPEIARPRTCWPRTDGCAVANAEQAARTRSAISCCIAIVSAMFFSGQDRPRAPRPPPRRCFARWGGSARRYRACRLARRSLDGLGRSLASRLDRRKLMILCQVFGGQTAKHQAMPPSEAEPLLSDNSVLRRSLARLDSCVTCLQSFSTACFSLRQWPLCSFC